MDANQQISRWLAMADVTAKSRIAKQINDKAKDDVCLICGKAANGSRGLCTADYLKFYRTMMALPKKERIAFEEEQIREGRVLASLQINSIRRPNPFLTTAAEKEAS
jgi:NAD(P)H-hydrate repair Nnr-like enzyme with NAD(P)H-hydrate epimerase domain